jgi:hypothetical protein
MWAGILIDRFVNRGMAPKKKKAESKKSVAAPVSLSSAESLFIICL